MSYLIQSDLYADMPQMHVEAALDDRPEAGSAGRAARMAAAWDAVLTSVGDEINGLLAPRYNYPHPEPLQPLLKTAARSLALEKLFNRRQMFGENNPARGAADAARTHLRQIGSGKILLDAGTVPVVPSGTAAAACGDDLRSKSKGLPI